MLRVYFRMKTVRQLLFISSILALLVGIAARARTVEDFDSGWLFSKSDHAAAMMPAFEDAAWQPVTLPHDWSSDGPFTAEFGSGNGYAPGGIGWYRKHFQLNTNAAGSCVSIEFDGIYDYSEVWINGQSVGGRPYGYSSFQCDLTPYVRFGASDNVVAVRVDHSRFADSRYYTGSGIYRNVRIVVTDPVHIPKDGVCILTPKVSASETVVTVETALTNEMDGVRDVLLQTVLLAPDGKNVGTHESHRRVGHDKGRGVIVSRQFYLSQPRLWSLDDPGLYRAVSRIVFGGKVLDEVTNTFGIREFRFDPDQGFFLNGRNMKIKGVCLHHDAGPIGAAVPDKVLERRLKTLKEIGVNAIRTSHNPPDPALLDMCDRMGFLVMDEAFDEFTPGKNKWVTGRNNGVPSHFGYNEIFDQWSVRDIQDLVRRDRNHPSIILWSIGNEIDYANDPFSDPVLGAEYRPHNPPARDLVGCARPLIAAVKELDRTRPVTAALATVAMSDAVGLAQLLDADGYNYQEARYEDDHRKYPHRIIYGSENGQRYDAWLAVKTNSFIAGQFLWTGADYLGEANEWPNRASGAGLLDLCGFKKPLAWFRQSLWSDHPMVYLCVSTGMGGRRGFNAVESWNWPSNSEVSVLCFANCSDVTLTLNGKAIGTQNMSEAQHGILRWELPYEPGTLEAVGRINGHVVCRHVLQTAGNPVRIELLPDTNQLRADAKDVSHLEFRIVDAQGIRVPDATPDVTFELTGPAKILGIGNGDLDSVEDCKSNRHHAYQGRGLAILQSSSSSGEIVVRATAPGLAPASTTLQSQ